MKSQAMKATLFMYCIYVVDIQYITHMCGWEVLIGGSLVCELLYCTHISPVTAAMYTMHRVPNLLVTLSISVSLSQISTCSYNYEYHRRTTRYLSCLCLSHLSHVK